MAEPNAPASPGIPGIDVSHYQGQIDWSAVAKAGVRYAMIKATDGTGPVDAYFHINWNAARNAGVIRGAYHFFRPKLTVPAQADLFVRTVARLEQGDLPPALDLEVPEDWAVVEENQRSALAIEWLESVEKGLGPAPIVYLSPAFADEVLVNPVALSRFPLWLAQYAAVPRVPKPWVAWTLWQYASDGRIGNMAPVDLNWFRGSEADLARILVRAPAPGVAG
jgi:lysozyme